MRDSAPMGYSKDHYGLSNHFDCLLNSLFVLTTTKKSKLHITDTLWRKPLTGSPWWGPVIRIAFPCHDVIVWWAAAFLVLHAMSKAYKSNPLESRRNERDNVSNHRRLHCLHNRLFRHKSKKTPKLRVTGLCEGNTPVTGEFPAQRASNVENVPIWWPHHGWFGWGFFCSYCHIKIFKGNESGALTLQPPLVIAFSPYQKLHVSTPLKMAEKIYCDWASQYSCLTQFPIGSFVRWYFKDGLINTNKVKSVPVNSQKVKSHG